MFYAYVCTDSSSLFNVSHAISLNLRFSLHAALEHFISWKSDNSVQTVIVIGNTCSLWQNHVLSVFLG